MAMFRDNRQITDEGIERLICRIRDEYQASNITFVEQTNHYCKFRGMKNGESYNYSYDKSSEFGFIIESED